MVTLALFARVLCASAPDLAAAGRHNHREETCRRRDMARLGLATAKLALLEIRGANKAFLRQY